MKTIKSKLTTAITVSSLFALIISYLILNITISKQFSLYLSRNQEQRDQKIVGIFRDAYTANGQNKWTTDSGTSVIPEARASSFSVKLEDAKGDLIWQLSPETIITELNLNREEKLPPITMEQFKIKRYPVMYSGNTVGYVTIGQYSPVIFSEDESRFVFSVVISVFLSAIIGGAVLFFMSVLLSNQLSQPIKSISSTSEQLSQGELSKRDDTETDILEIQKLKDNINILGDKLDKQDILRKRLISDISHELRNPLNVLQTNLEAMIDGVIPLTNERLMSLNNEVIRFGKLIGNLNVLKEFEAETLDIQFKEVNLQVLCQDIYNNFHGKAAAKNQILIYEYYKKDRYVVLGEYNSLYQVVVNLLYNAMKFTPDGGKISLTLRKDTLYTYVDVKDSGMGIPEEDLPNIFERFYRVDKSREMVEGSGIGLTIVKKIMDAHGAKVSVTSKIDEGTVFTLRFKNPPLDNIRTLSFSRHIPR